MTQQVCFPLIMPFQFNVGLFAIQVFLPVNIFSLIFFIGSSAPICHQNGLIGESNLLMGKKPLDKTLLPYNKFYFLSHCSK